MRPRATVLGYVELVLRVALTGAPLNAENLIPVDGMRQGR